MGGPIQATCRNLPGWYVPVPHWRMTDQAYSLTRDTAAVTVNSLPSRSTDGHGPYMASVDEGMKEGSICGTRIAGARS